MNFPQQYKQSCVGFFFGPSLFPHLDGPEFSTFFINILKVAFLHPDPDLRVPMLVEKTLVLEHQALLVRLPISPGMTTKIARYEYPYYQVRIPISPGMTTHITKFETDITTRFHRLTQMSGFTTWSNSLSTGHSLSGT